MRVCRCCGITEKTIPFFSRLKLRKTGKRTMSYENICMICKRENTSESGRKHWEKNKEKRKAASKKWKLENKEKYNESQRVWYKKKRLKRYNIDIEYSFFI